VGSEEEEHEEGAAVFAPAGTSHGVVNATTGDARLLVMMTPPPSKP